jgi:signal transduction histidine kinase
MLALEEAEASNKLKSAFLAQMSHEIRTPLNVILTSVPLLADEIGAQDEEVRTVINSVGSAGKRLQRTIDMILNMSAVQSGNYKPDFEEINLADELDKLVYEVKSLVNEKRLKISFESEIDEPLILADKYTVTQIFQNLIGNSIKYTHKGFVKVSIKKHGMESYKVDVIDTGIGMNEDYLEKLFSPFSQEDIGQKRQYEGNGLGLALVKKYVELNNAEISVESQKNKGSVFSVVFARPDVLLKSESINQDKMVSLV